MCMLFCLDARVLPGMFSCNILLLKVLSNIITVDFPAMYKTTAVEAYLGWEIIETWSNILYIASNVSFTIFDVAIILFIKL